MNEKRLPKVLIGQLDEGEGRTMMNWKDSIEKSLKYYKLSDGISLEMKKWKFQQYFLGLRKFITQ